MDESDAKRSTDREIRQNKTLRALLDNYRYELTGGRPVPIADVAALAATKPWARDQSTPRCRLKASRWADFAAFMAARFPAARNAADIQKSHVEAYSVALSASGKYVAEKNNRRGARRYRAEPHRLSGATVRSILGDLRGLFAKVMEDAGAVTNPFDAIVVRPTETAERQVFTPEELARIGEGISTDEERQLSVCVLREDAERALWLRHADFCRPLFIVASLTGLSEGDICDLKWSDFDWGESVIRRRRNKTGSRILVPILPALASYLGTLPAGGEYVFPEHRSVYDCKGVSSRVKGFLNGLGIETQLRRPGFVAVSVKDLHSMRHVFCYYATRAGIPATLVAKIVGHKTVAMTEHYADHSTAADLRTAIAKMPLILPDGGVTDAPDEADAERRRLLDAVRLLPPDKVRSILSRLNA
jgi:integrase